jgi:mRNA interferase RelE/StbE
MLEPKELLAPTAALFAVIFAIFGFLFPRALTLSRERKAALSEIDVPDHVRKRLGFKIGALGDAFLLYMTSVSLLILGIIYCPALLYRIANFYLGSQMFSSSEILSDFRDLSLWFGILSSAVLVAVLALLSNDVFVSKRLPLLVRVYIGNVLGQRASKAEADSLLPEARSLYKKGAFGESVLYSMASLELALRDKLGIPAGVGFGKLLGSVSEKLGDVISVGELIEIRRVRNVAAHPLPERRVKKQDAKEVLRLVGNILQRLQGDYYVILAPEAQSQLNKLQKRYFNLVNKVISTLSQEPRPRGVKRLAEGDLWLVRVGQYRISYTIDDEERQITVVQVSKRTGHA